MILYKGFHLSMEEMEFIKSDMSSSSVILYMCRCKLNLLYTVFILHFIYLYDVEDKWCEGDVNVICFKYRSDK